MPGGDTEVGNNGSVYWRSTHYGTGPKPRKLKCKKTGDPHRNDEIDVDGDDALGKDTDTTLQQVGERFGHAGFFRVTLRYKTEAAAKGAGVWGSPNLTPVGTEFHFIVRVPAIPRDNHSDDPPFEVKVQW